MAPDWNRQQEKNQSDNRPGYDSGSGSNSNEYNEYNDSNPAPPSYEESWQSSSSQPPPAVTTTTESKQQQQQPNNNNSEPSQPTIESPFTFPPTYSTPSASPSASASASTSSHPPPFLLAIPQTTSNPKSPFLPSYSTPHLLPLGIPQETFTSFLHTLSGFLSSSSSSSSSLASISPREIGRNLSREIASHARDVGQSIASSARSGRIISAGVGLAIGAVTVPVAASIRLAAAALTAPLSSSSSSPRERAEGYVAVAQRDWFGGRGIKARLCDTRELIAVIIEQQEHRFYSHEGGMRNLVDLVHRTRDKGPRVQIEALHAEFGIEKLEITDPRAAARALDVGAGTLWLVLMTDDARC
ncbi:hypothetical protein GGS20DRAFT_548387 [Poronia punctata]|nr:hypothetical protein GGS20DRAFT_548387 [Poronia punctata]